MSTSKSASNAGTLDAAAKSSFSWGEVVPKFVGRENAMSPKKSTEIWTALYAAAGLAGANEQVQMSFRAATYVYFCINGTSRAGNYAATIELSDGRSYSAAVYPQIIHSDQRRFMRANAVESYNFFKETRVMEKNGEYVARAAVLGIGPEQAFAMADWFTDCPMLTPGEVAAHDKSFTYAVQRSRRARGGKGLEEVESDRLQDSLNAQGPAEASGSAIKWD